MKSMKYIHCAVFLFIAIFTGSITAQERGLSQETTDALQSQRIQQLEFATTANTKSVDRLSIEMATMTSTMERFIGIGIGFGAALTVLQGILLIVTFRNGKKGA